MDTTRLVSISALPRVFLQSYICKWPLEATWAEFPHTGTVVGSFVHYPAPAALVDC